MNELSTGETVSLDGSQGQDVKKMSYYDFNDIILRHDGGNEDAMESESLVDDKGVHLDDLQFDTNLVSLYWESSTPPPGSLLSDCFFEFDTVVKDGFVDHDKIEATEVSEDDMDLDTTTLEHRFQETAKRLAESMEKSRKTRVSLTLKTAALGQYPLRKSIDNVVSSVQESSEQLLTTFQAGNPTTRASF